jgi:hypothetical protein
MRLVLAAASYGLTVFGGGGDGEGAEPFGVGGAETRMPEKWRVRLMNDAAAAQARLQVEVSHAKEDCLSPFGRRRDSEPAPKGSRLAW